MLGKYFSKMFYFYFLDKEAALNLSFMSKEEMKNTSWIRKNWLLVAGISFIGVHVGTYFLQRSAKQSVKSQSQSKQKSIEE